MTASASGNVEMSCSDVKSAECHPLRCVLETGIADIPRADRARKRCQPAMPLAPVRSTRRFCSIRKFLESINYSSGCRCREILGSYAHLKIASDLGIERVCRDWNHQLL